MLFNEITSPSKISANRTDIHIADFLAILMTNHTTDNANLPSFKNVMLQVVGADSTVDVGAMNIHAFQDILGQALSKTLNATLSAWNTPYFDALAKNGALLDGSQLEKAPQLNDTLSQIPASQSFEVTGNSTDLALNNSGRGLLTQDVYKKGNYSIVECDANDIGGLADQVSALLDLIHHNLFLVMHETSKGQRSEYGFSKLWRTPKWLPIHKMYMTMYNNDPITGSVARYRNIESNRPIFMCLQPHNRATWAAHNVCKAEPRLRAFQDPERPNLIALCPSFWALPSQPPRAFCPYKGRITASYIGTALQLNQQAVIIHQLVRMYLGKENILDEEVYGLSGAMQLDLMEAYRNPSSWAYFYSCECQIYSIATIYFTNVI